MEAVRLDLIRAALASPGSEVGFARRALTFWNRLRHLDLPGDLSSVFKSPKRLSRDRRLTAVRSGHGVQDVGTRKRGPGKEVQDVRTRTWSRMWDQVWFWVPSCRFC